MSTTDHLDPVALPWAHALFVKPISADWGGTIANALTEAKIAFAEDAADDDAYFNRSFDYRRDHLQTAIFCHRNGELEGTVDALRSFWNIG